MGDASFQDQMVALVRAFGFHRPARTPCGQPVSIAEAHALLELSKRSPLTQHELVASLNLEKSTVSRLVSLLEDRGWVSRTRNGSDGRVRDVSLTSAGEEAAGDLAAARRRKMDAVLKRIPEGRQPAVLDSLQLLVKAMRESDA